MTKKFYIAVYGSLREGLYNHTNHLKGLKPTNVISLKRYKMYDLGYYPMIAPSRDSKDKVKMELYEVGPQAFLRIHNMELGAGYDFSFLRGPNNQKYIYYHYKEDKYNLDEVKSGDWKKYVESTGAIL